MSNKNYKMYILVNEDVKMSKGKIASQVGHAVAVYFWRTFQDIQTRVGYEQLGILREYMENEQKKIILKCSQEQLEMLEYKRYIAIRDKGYTQIEANTLTCVNAGIYVEDEVPNWIKELKLYS